MKGLRCDYNQFLVSKKPMTLDDFKKKLMGRVIYKDFAQEIDGEFYARKVPIGTVKILTKEGDMYHMGMLLCTQEEMERFVKWQDEIAELLYYDFTLDEKTDQI